MTTILEEEAFKFLSALTEEGIMNSFESGTKINCVFITDIVYTTVTLGGNLLAPGIIMVFGRYHAGDLNLESVAGEIKAIANQCLQQYQQQNLH